VVAQVPGDVLGGGARRRLAQSTVSAHLSCPRGCGLVVSGPAGRASLHSLVRPELLDLLATAEQLLAATGEAVDRCATYGTFCATGRTTS